jgi:dTDP-4-dehydrorhamnose 3,5-epimerase
MFLKVSPTVFLTLTSDSEVFYQISEMFHSECAMGVRWDDKAFGIAWPGTPKVISSRDAQYPDYCPMIGGEALQS